MPLNLRKILRTVLRPVIPRLFRKDDLRAVWGKAGEADGFAASWHFKRVIEQGETAAHVDDRTWEDLELPRLFREMDTTVSLIGRQCLYTLLRTYEFDPEELSRRQTDYVTLQNNAALRERLQIALQGAAHHAAAYVADLLWGNPPIVGGSPLVALSWVVLTLLAVAGAVVHWVPFWLPVLMVTVNTVIAFKIDPVLGREADAILECARLLSVARNLEQAGAPGALPCLDRLRSMSESRRTLSAQVRGLALLERVRSVELVGGLVVVANVFFLAKLLIYHGSIRKLSGAKTQWQALYRLIGQIDAQIALAHYLHRKPDHCVARITQERVLQFEEGYHPLLTSPVPSSFNLTDQSALVTGSNMTGKTTFIKMVAINALLSNTVGICLARSATIPRARVMSSIRGDQSVDSGASRYFAEVEAVRRFLEAPDDSHSLFVIDEPFSGTNTVERIAIAKAVLGALSSKAQVLATTHDVELQHLLGQQYRMFHFREDPAVEGFFDHKLYQGVSHERNAIRILERLKFPQEIIAEALATVKGHPY